MTRRRPVDEGVLAARLQGAGMRWVHSGTSEKLVQLAGGRTHLLTEQAALWRCSAADPLPAHGPAAARLLDAAADETTRAGR